MLLVYKYFKNKASFGHRQSLGKVIQHQKNQAVTWFLPYLLN